jgi:hypothetical protein
MSGSYDPKQKCRLCPLKLAHHRSSRGGSGSVVTFVSFTVTAVPGASSNVTASLVRSTFTSLQKHLLTSFLVKERTVSLRNSPTSCVIVDGLLGRRSNP